jgi:hypothetical protein
MEGLALDAGSYGPGATRHLDQFIVGFCHVAGDRTGGRGRRRIPETGGARLRQAGKGLGRGDRASGAIFRTLPG